MGRLRKQEGLLLDDTTFQTALLETNNPTTKYKLSSVHEKMETEEKSLIETDAKSVWWEDKSRFPEWSKAHLPLVYTIRRGDYKFKI